MYYWKKCHWNWNIICYLQSTCPVLENESNKMKYETWLWCDLKKLKREQKGPEEGANGASSSLGVGPSSVVGTLSTLSTLSTAGSDGNVLALITDALLPAIASVSLGPSIGPSGPAGSAEPRMQNLSGPAQSASTQRPQYSPFTSSSAHPAPAVPQSNSDALHRPQAADAADAADSQARLARETLMQRTGMNELWSVKCLQENNWNLDAALAVFLQLKVCFLFYILSERWVLAVGYIRWINLVQIQSGTSNYTPLDSELALETISKRIASKDL